MITWIWLEIVVTFITRLPRPMQKTMGKGESEACLRGKSISCGREFLKVLNTLFDAPNTLVNYQKLWKPPFPNRKNIFKISPGSPIAMSMCRMCRNTVCFGPFGSWSNEVINPFPIQVTLPIGQQNPSSSPAMNGRVRKLKSRFPNSGLIHVDTESTFQ